MGSSDTTPGVAPSTGAFGGVSDAVSGVASDVAGALGLGQSEDNPVGVAANVGNENMSTVGQTAQMSAAGQPIGAENAGELAASHPDISTEGVQQGLSADLAAEGATTGTLGQVDGLGSDVTGVQSAISNVASAAIPGITVDTLESPISNRSVTTAEVNPVSALGTMAGVPTGFPGVGNVDDVLGTNVDLGTSVSGPHSGMGPDGMSGPGSPGSGGIGPGGGPGGGPPTDPTQQSDPDDGSDEPDDDGDDENNQPTGAFSYQPFQGDYTTYGQPGGTPSHAFFPDITAGVSTAWDETMKANQ
jgi:hypothetical protein